MQYTYNNCLLYLFLDIYLTFWGRELILMVNMKIRNITLFLFSSPCHIFPEYKFYLRFTIEPIYISFAYTGFFRVFFSFRYSVMYKRMPKYRIYSVREYFFRILSTKLWRRRKKYFSELNKILKHTRSST